MRVIKRYPNRKLYDTEDRQYVTLDQIAGLIRQGEEVHVVDHAAGDDLTALTLSQIIFEQEKKHSGFLPHTLLSGLIQSGGDRFNALHRAAASTLGFGAQVEQEIERRVQALVSAGELSAAEGSRLLEQLLAAPEAPEDREISAIAARVVEKLLAAYHIPTRGDVQRLVEQIDRLSAELDEMKAASADES